MQMAQNLRFLVPRRHPSAAAHPLLQVWQHKTKRAFVPIHVLLWVFGVFVPSRSWEIITVHRQWRKKSRTNRAGERACLGKNDAFLTFARSIHGWSAWEKRRSLCECCFSLCLSRACLGQKIGLIHKSLKRTFFFSPPREVGRSMRMRGGCPVRRKTSLFEFSYSVCLSRRACLGKCSVLGWVNWVLKRV